MGRAVQTVGHPGRAGRDDGERGAAIKDSVGVQSGSACELDVSAPLELTRAVRDDVGPLRETRQTGDPPQSTPRLIVRIDERDTPHPAPSQDESALEAGGASANHEHLALGVCRRL